jgi:acetyl-CoA acetyltransferase
MPASRKNRSTPPGSARACRRSTWAKPPCPLSTTLRLPMIPVTRVENYCATGTEAFRGAVYGVASGAYDICLALGVEKLKDTGYGGLPNFRLVRRQPGLAVVAQPDRAGRLRPAGQRLCSQVPD